MAHKAVTFRPFQFLIGRLDTANLDMNIGHGAGCFNSS